MMHLHKRVKHDPMCNFQDPLHGCFLPKIYYRKTESLSVGEAPDRVVKIALRAANLIGDGFYGVDIKQIGKRLYVIEINDNPNVDTGNEDSVLKDALYSEVMGVFLKRGVAR